MSRYPGWNQGGRRDDSLEMTQKKRRLNTEGTFTSPPLEPSISFNQPSISTVHKPSRGARARKSERKSIYDLPEDPIREVQTLENYKEPVPKTPPLTKHGSGWPLNQTAIINTVSRLTTPPDSTLRQVQKLRKCGNSDTVSNGVVEKHIWTPAGRTANKSNSNAMDFPCGQTTLEKLAAFRFRGPKEPSAAPGSCFDSGEIRASGVAPSSRNTVTRGSLLTSKYHDETSHPFIEGEATASYGEEPSTEEGDTAIYGEEPPMEDLIDLESMQWQDVSPQGNAASSGFGTEDVTNLDSIPWEDISLLEDESNDEFPMSDNEVAEMARLQADTHGTIISPSPFQIQGGQDFQDHEASHDYQISSAGSPCRNSNIENILSKSPMSRSSITSKPTLSSSLNVNPSSIPEGEERISAETVQTSEGNHRPKVQAQHPQINDSADYLPLPRFARPPFPTKVSDRSPIIGVSGGTILRTCFRIGEIYSKGILRERSDQEIIIELFARVKLSWMDPQTRVYDFEFSDLFHDGPPFLKGRLENVKRDSLQEKESRELLGEGISGRMVRCLGVLTGMDERSVGMLRIINIRASDWEEIRWTKRILDGGAVGLEKEGGGGSGEMEGDDDGDDALPDTLK